MEVQKKTGRTPKGRIIGKSLIPKIENSLKDPKVDSAKMAECNNCGFVINEEYFFDGCMNCRSKDFEQLGKR